MRRWLSETDKSEQPSDFERICAAFVTEYQRYVVQGTSVNDDYMPPYRAPWYLIDASKAEPEVNWPGDLVAESDHPKELERMRWCRGMLAALKAMREPSKAQLHFAASNATYRLVAKGHWQAMLDELILQGEQETGE